jgi:hypothetical protein
LRYVGVGCVCVCGVCVCVGVEWGWGSCRPGQELANLSSQCGFSASK